MHSQIFQEISFYISTIMRLTNISFVLFTIYHHHHHHHMRHSLVCLFAVHCFLQNQSHPYHHHHRQTSSCSCHCFLHQTRHQMMSQSLHQIHSLYLVEVRLKRRHRPAPSHYALFFFVV